MASGSQKWKSGEVKRQLGPDDINFSNRKPSSQQLKNIYPQVNFLGLEPPAGMLTDSNGALHTFDIQRIRQTQMDSLNLEALTEVVFETGFNNLAQPVGTQQDRLEDKEMDKEEQRQQQEIPDKSPPPSFC